MCLSNGTLNPLTGELLQHSPDFHLRNVADIAFDPAAQCPMWLRCLDDIFRDDLDKAEKILLLKQWCGYSLVPMTKMHKFLVMVGAGSNGKSTVLDVLARIVGEGNISRAMVERLGRKEVLANLDGKLLNISPEMSANAWKYSSYIKAIVSGDTVQARKLYKNPFSFKPVTRLVMATNTYPKLVDDSDGFARRLMILTFNRQFTEGEQNKQLANELYAELPGILNWAIAGLQQLLADDQFVVPESSEAAKTRYRIESCHVRLFLEECLDPDTTGAGMAAKDVYALYEGWAKEACLSTLNKFTFGKRLGRAGVAHQHTRNGESWMLSRKSVTPSNVITLATAIALPTPQIEEQKAA
jgi:putative DNA primase/helicase